MKVGVSRMKDRVSRMKVGVSRAKVRGSRAEVGHTGAVALSLPLRVLYQGQDSLEQFIGAFVLMPGAAELVTGVIGYSLNVRLYLFPQRM